MQLRTLRLKYPASPLIVGGWLPPVPRTQPWGVRGTVQYAKCELDCSDR
jgi:hypothetical protein